MRQRATCALSAWLPRLGEYMATPAAKACRGRVLRRCTIHAWVCTNVGCRKRCVPNCCVVDRRKCIARSAWWQLGRCDYWARLGCACNVRRCASCPRTLEPRRWYGSTAVGCNGQSVRWQLGTTTTQLVHVLFPTRPQRFRGQCKQPCVHRHAVATMVARFRFTSGC